MVRGYYYCSLCVAEESTILAIRAEFFGRGCVRASPIQSLALLRPGQHRRRRIIHNYPVSTLQSLLRLGALQVSTAWRAVLSSAMPLVKSERESIG